MHIAPGIHIYEPRGQGALLLLATLLQLHGNQTKASVRTYLQSHRWFEFQDQDKLPHDAQPKGGARWNVILSWARKDCVASGCIPNRLRDQWLITDAGRENVLGFRKRFLAGELDVRRCYLWSQSFKSFIDPRYVPGAADARRPPSFYETFYPHDVDDLLRKVGF